jgi:hypothetical protein
MLKLEDIKVGMRVNPDDLREIYHTLIILANFEGDIGEILYIGDVDTKESYDIYMSYDNTCTVYHIDEEEELWDE